MREAGVDDVGFGGVRGYVSVGMRACCRSADKCPILQSCKKTLYN